MSCSKFIILLLFFLPLSTFAQLDESLQLSGKNMSELKTPLSNLSIFSNSLKTFSFNAVFQDVVLKEKSAVLCQKYNGKAPTAFFCRMEDELERKIKFPVRMRLGSLNYVDQLEQKNSYVPNQNY